MGISSEGDKLRSERERQVRLSTLPLSTLPLSTSSARNASQVSFVHPPLSQKLCSCPLSPSLFLPSLSKTGGFAIDRRAVGLVASVLGGGAASTTLAFGHHTDWVKTIGSPLPTGLGPGLRFEWEAENIRAKVLYREGVVAFPARVGNMEARDKEREGG